MVTIFILSEEDINININVGILTITTDAGDKIQFEPEAFDKLKKKIKMLEDYLESKKLVN